MVKVGALGDDARRQACGGDLLRGSRISASGFGRSGDDDRAGRGDLAGAVGNLGAALLSSFALGCVDNRSL